VDLAIREPGSPLWEARYGVILISADLEFHPLVLFQYVETVFLLGIAAEIFQFQTRGPGNLRLQRGAPFIAQGVGNLISVGKVQMLGFEGLELVVHHQVEGIVARGIDSHVQVQRRDVGDQDHARVPVFAGYFPGEKAVHGVQGNVELPEGPGIGAADHLHAEVRGEGILKIYAGAGIGD